MSNVWRIDPQIHEVESHSILKVVEENNGDECIGYMWNPRISKAGLKKETSEQNFEESMRTLIWG